MQELYDIAVETNLMLAPANSPKEILNSVQLDARGYFEPYADLEKFPHSFLTIVPGPAAAAGVVPPAGIANPKRAWSGVNILEFGSGAAGPIATRYFAEHGANVLRIESKSRPDFLRVYALGPKNKHGLEGSVLFDGLNVNKMDFTLNLKNPEAVALIDRLVLEWADGICENFAPRAMRGFGLDYKSLLEKKPDLVMVSACLNGQTGPHKDYPGFGGQGSALSGYNWLTGWPDREPVGPYGTITDSLAPRFVAAALAAGLLHRRKTGEGVYLDVSQVEAAIYTLTPWLIEYERDGIVGMRAGNRHPLAVPHGAFPCADEGDVGDRWIAIAAWTDDEWATLAGVIGLDDPALATFATRAARIDEVEALVGVWTAGRTRIEIAEQLQALGLEAVPVEDLGDAHTDPQLIERQHFVRLTHPFMGPQLYERNGFRLSDATSGYERSSPTLGQDNDYVLGEVLNLSAEEQERLREAGAAE
jgi:crotonobetainyl-CoA:carnitine CoA-transferase CaiB-like acyl-CoA transferase